MTKGTDNKETTKAIQELMAEYAPKIYLVQRLANQSKDMNDRNATWEGLSMEDQLLGVLMRLRNEYADKLKELSDGLDVATKKMIFQPDLAMNIPAKTDLAYGIYRKVINSGTLACIDQCIIQNPNCWFPETDVKTGKVLGYHYATRTELGNSKNAVTLVWRKLPVDPVDIENKTVTAPKIMQEAVDLHLFVRMKYLEKRSRALVFSLDDYMAARNLKDTPRNRKRVAISIDRACEMLKKVEMHVDSMNGWTGWGWLYVSSGYKNSRVSITISDELMFVLEAAHKQYAWMPYDHMLDIDRERNPNTLPIIMLLAQNKAMNHRKAGHGDIIHMKYIISKLQRMAEYQQACLSFSEFEKYIIRPIERDMNISDKVYAWEYIKGGNTSIEDFIGADIRITWKLHPQDNKEFQDDLVKQAILSLQKSSKTKSKPKEKTAKSSKTRAGRK